MVNYPRDFIIDKFTLHDAYVVDTYPDATFSVGSYTPAGTETFTINSTRNYRTNNSLYVTHSPTVIFYHTPAQTVDYTKYTHAHAEIYTPNAQTCFLGVLYNNTNYRENHSIQCAAGAMNRVDCWLSGAKYAGTGSVLPSSNYVTLSVEFNNTELYMNDWILYNHVTSSEYTNWITINGNMRISQPAKVSTMDIAGRYGNVTQHGKQGDMVYNVEGMEGISASALLSFLKAKVGTQVLFMNSDMIRAPVILESFDFTPISSDTVQYRLTLREYNND